MKDERFTELLGKRLAGELSAEESAEFTGYISANQSYKKEYESLKSYWQQEDAPDEHTIALFEKIKKQTDIAEITGQQQQSSHVIGKPNSLPLYRQWQAIAAILAIALLSFGTYQFFSADQRGQQTTSIKWKRFYTPARVRSVLTLPDGSKVTLNSASALRYPAAFSGDTREVYLTGEAYLDVAHDRKHPFILHTEKMDIRVLGTQFNVKSYADDSTKEATLFRGSIAVTFPEYPDSRVLLKPSEKVVVKNSGYERSTTAFFDNENHYHMETMWMKGQLAFRDASLGSIANSLARKYGVKMVFKNNNIRNLKFSGSFEKETLSEALHSLQIVTPFNFTIKRDTVYLY